MNLFENLKHGAHLRSLEPGCVAEVVQVARFGADALNLIYRVNGRVKERLVHRGEETAFQVVGSGRTYAFVTDGGFVRMASESGHIRLAHLFDCYMAVSASQIEALPQRITALAGSQL